MADAVWTDERVALLRKLHAEDLPFSAIAARLGSGITRNAAIGKATRINLPQRDRSAVQRRYRTSSDISPRSKREPSAPVIEKKVPRVAGIPNPKQGGSRKPRKVLDSSAPVQKKLPPIPIQRAVVLPEPQPLRLVDLPKGGRITILHLSDKTCKWPIGNPGTEDFCFCGHAPRDKSPYCEYHARAAYQPIQDRRHRSFG